LDDYRGFVLLCISAVSIGTQAQILNTVTRYTLNVPLREYFQPLPQIVDFIEHFSLFKSIMSLLTVDKKEGTQTSFVEAATVALVIGATFVQSAFLVDSSLGLSVLRELTST
jgi:hypothetical protein